MPMGGEPFAMGVCEIIILRFRGKRAGHFRTPPPASWRRRAMPSPLSFSQGTRPARWAWAFWWMQFLSQGSIS